LGRSAPYSPTTPVRRAKALRLVACVTELGLDLGSLTERIGTTTERGLQLHIFGGRGPAPLGQSCADRTPIGPWRPRWRPSTRQGRESDGTSLAVLLPGLGSSERTAGYEPALECRSALCALFVGLKGQQHAVNSATSRVAPGMVLEARSPQRLGMNRRSVRVAGIRCLYLCCHARQPGYTGPRPGSPTWPRTHSLLRRPSCSYFRFRSVLR
jgi:hypothetical protein